MVHIFNTLTAEFIYLEQFVKCAGPINWPITVKWLDFMKNENDEISIFLQFYVYLMVSTIFGVFLWKAYQTLPPCKNFPTGLASIINKKQKIVNKRAACNHHLWHEHCHWGIGIQRYTFGSMIRPEQSHSLSGALLPRWQQATYSLQRAAPPFILQKRCLNSLFMIKFWDYGKKGVLFYEIYPLLIGRHLPNVLSWLIGLQFKG